ncbi:MAG: DUF4129 domain-containing protein [Ginsengibacter sp.]
MKNKLAIFIHLVFLLLIYSNSAFAQTKALDSATLSGSHREYMRGRHTMDLSINDSIQKFRQSGEFRYMSDLDSLLRAETYLKKDSLRLDEGGGGIIRKRKEGNDVSAINRILNSAPLQLFFWILAVLFVLFISYRLFAGQSFFKRRKNYLSEKIEEDYPQKLADLSQYDTLIGEAENKGYYNLAVRYLFLRTIKNLTDKGLINFDPSKTNKKYVEEMRGNSDAVGFESLVYNYEYIWYGKFSITDDTYRRLREKYQLFNQKA